MAIMLAAVGGGIYWSVAADKKRTEAMRMVAMTLGYAFEDPCDKDGLATLVGDMPLFDRGHGRKAQRMMRGKVGERQAAVFDYRYTTGGGKSSHTHFQTVVFFPALSRPLPDFELSPENFLHRIGQVFGYQDIDFDSNEEFSKAYLLRGPDETAIRAAFSPNVLAYFAGSLNWHVQSRSGRLCVFRHGRFVPPDDMRSFIADAERLAGVVIPR